MPSMSTTPMLTEKDARDVLAKRGYAEAEITEFIKQAKQNPI